MLSKINFLYSKVCFLLKRVLPLNVYEALIINNDASESNPFVLEGDLKTINGESLIGNTDIVISTDITVGTTPIISGVDNRILYQSGGVVQQNSKLTYNGSTLNVQAGGALSTDINFRVRNSAGYSNLLHVQGDGVVAINNAYVIPNSKLSVYSPSSIGIASIGTTGIYGEADITGGGTRTGVVGFARSYGAGSVAIGGDFVADGGGNGYGIRALQSSSGSGINYAAYLSAYNGGTNYALYCKQGDIRLGGSGDKFGVLGATPITKITTGVAAAAFAANTSGIVNDSATYDGYTIGQIVKSLRNYGLLT